ncbi:unnamed protein product [Symbiodinium sp. CCMP2456]|nr:unnamed protein product [Symbiodinium sp. CCMP2456]
MASAGSDMQFHMVQVRNTFLEVQTSEDVGPKSIRPRRSKSWSGSSSSNSCHENSSGDAEKEQWFSVTVSGQAHHSVFDENSSSSSALDPDSWENAMQEFKTPWESAMHEFQSSSQCSSPSSRRLPPPPPPPRDGAQVVPAVQLRIEEQINDDYQPQYGQSIGAKGHGRGKCTPCTRILVRPGCEFGSRCMFCHLEHSDQMDSRKNRHRPCKAARQQHKQTIQKVYEEYKDNPEKKKKALEKPAVSKYCQSDGHENSSADAEKEQWFSVAAGGQAHHSVFEENSFSSSSSALESESWDHALHEFQSSSSASSRRQPPPPRDDVQGAQAAQSRMEAIEELLDDDYQPQYGQSIGAKGHGRGKCTPCTRILVRPGCDFGARCMFCHLEHPSHMDSKKNRHRPCKAARQQYKQTIQKIYEEYKDNPDKKKKALEKIAETSPYMRSLLKGLGEKDEDEVLARLGQAVEEEELAPRVPGLQRPPGEVGASPASASSSSAPSPKPESKAGKSLISL